MTSFSTEQEAFWAGEFGDEYSDRNIGAGWIAANTSLFAKVLDRTRGVKSVVEFGANIGLNLRAIDTLIALGRLPASLGPAYAVLARLLVVVRLVAPDAAEPPPATCALIARALGMADWSEVLATLAATRQDVAAAWAATTEDDDG